MGMKSFAEPSAGPPGRVRPLSDLVNCVFFLLGLEND